MSQLSFEFPAQDLHPPARKPRPQRKPAVAATVIHPIEEPHLPLYSAPPPTEPNAESNSEPGSNLRAETETTDAVTESLESDTIRDARHWAQDGWSARVVKNPEDDGWAVEMMQDGESEPALVCPWTMGRDKKNPKPLDHPAFLALVKSASEVLQRQRQQLHSRLHKQVDIACDEGPVTVTLDIVPDEYEPHALLRATDAGGDELACIRVAADFRLTNASARAWMDGGFEDPARAYD